MTNESSSSITSLNCIYQSYGWKSVKTDGQRIDFLQATFLQTAAVKIRIYLRPNEIQSLNGIFILFEIHFNDKSIILLLLV